MTVIVKLTEFSQLPDEGLKRLDFEQTADSLYLWGHTL